MQRFLSALSITLLIGMAAMAQVQPPPVDPIDRVVSTGLMTLNEDGDFRPDAPITRSELANILVRAFLLDRRTPIHPDLPPPTDVPENHWAYEDIQIVMQTGVMQGYSEGRFFPNQLVNRAEGFSIFAQAYGVSQFSPEVVDEILADYADEAQIPPWARQSVATAVYAGFVNTEPGEEGDRLDPLSPMTRADMAYALAEFLDHQESPDGRI
jgi:hypothetical protein